MNEETKPPTTSDAVTEQDKGRCAPAPGWPASLIAHWPNQDVPCCDEHARKINNLSGVLGFTLSFTPAPPGSECVNCKNEKANDELCEPPAKNREPRSGTEGAIGGSQQ